MALFVVEDVFYLSFGDVRNYLFFQPFVFLAVFQSDLILGHVLGRIERDVSEMILAIELGIELFHVPERLVSVDYTVKLGVDDENDRSPLDIVMAHLVVNGAALAPRS